MSEPVVDHDAAMTIALNWSPDEHRKYGEQMFYGIGHLARAYLAKCAEVEAVKEDFRRLRIVAANQEARAEAAEARCAAMRKYVRHIPPCLGVIRPCICGFDAALAET